MGELISLTQLPDETNSVIRIYCAELHVTMAATVREIAAIFKQQ